MNLRIARRTSGRRAPLAQRADPNVDGTDRHGKSGRARARARGLLAGVAASLAAGLAAGQSLRCDGVLGNSGEGGETLVIYGGAAAAPAAVGAGVAVDEAGALWTRGGDGVLLRLSPDGRLLAHYGLPPGAGSAHEGDTLTLAGAYVVVKQRDRVAVLPRDARPGAVATNLALRADRISFQATPQGWLAGSRGTNLFRFDPATGQSQSIGVLPEPATGLEQGPDGACYVLLGNRLRRFADSREDLSGWPRPAPGERPQLLDGWWWGHAWHGTIRRFAPDLTPSPGVVLGGASGSFIGHLDENPDVTNGRGLAKLRDGLFAVSGMGGVVQLLVWREAEQRFDLVRRLGALPACAGLALDRQGRVYCGSGNWEWNDGPATPLRNGVPSAAVGQPVLLANDVVVAPAVQYGSHARLLTGTLDAELKTRNLPDDLTFARPITAAAVWREDSGLRLLLAQRDGTAQACRLGTDGTPGGPALKMRMQFAAPVTNLTSLAVQPAPPGGPATDLLLAAVDGAVAVLARDPDGWTEQRRWQCWGPAPADRFGGPVWICADSGRLWVSDRARHRVLLFNLAGGRPLVAFGTVDMPGNALDSLRHPETLAAAGGRAVVFDQGNQRLLKLRFEAEHAIPLEPQ